MPKKRFSAGQVVTLLRQIEVLVAQGKSGTGSVPGSGDIGAELRDELLNGEIFYSLKEAQVVIEQWRKHYNTIRPHSAIGYRPPAPQTINRSCRRSIRSGICNNLSITLVQKSRQATSIKIRTGDGQCGIKAIGVFSL